MNTEVPPQQADVSEEQVIALWQKRLPNQLTMARLILAALFFLSLMFFHYVPYDHEADAPAWLLKIMSLNTAIFWVTIGLFLAAVFTDFLDGFLARRWKAESSFGRIMDPFCDKLLIIGGFIYLAGARFQDPNVGVEYTGAAAHYVFFGLIELPYNQLTGVFPFMVIIILGRELLVTSVRGEMERAGIKFGANWFGKWKMVLQSICIPVVLLIVWLDPYRHDALVYVRDALVWATVIATVGSGMPYLLGAFKVMGAEKEA